MRASEKNRKSSLAPPVHQRKRQSVETMATMQQTDHKIPEIKVGILRKDSLLDHNRRLRMLSLQDARLLQTRRPSDMMKGRTGSLEGKHWVSRDRAPSLDPSNKAFHVTRRLSRSHYMLTGEDISMRTATPHYENTYKTKPDEDKIFRPSQVEKVMTEILEMSLGERKYIAGEASLWACQISDAIKDGVKELNFPRHKIVCNVIIAEKQRQGLSVSSLALWDKGSDNYASSSFSNDTLLAVATVHGIYYE